jgi:phage repressor protein C with HTH and peptisase S24 domain
LQRTPSDVREVLQKWVGAGVQAGGAEVKLGINLDDAYLSGVLQQMVERVSANVEMIQTHSVPVINRVSAGYPSDFTDLSYPPRVADEYVGCPEVNDKDAFAARVHGDSMTPKYKQGDIVIFSPAADPREGDDCFVRFEDGQTTFKRVFFENDEEGAAVLRLQPRNEKYRPQVVSAESVSGLYRAMYRYQRVDEEEGKG